MRKIALRSLIIMKEVINMTKKDYINIADAIKENECCANCVYKPGLIRDLINVFKCGNERFNSDTFKDYING